MQAAGMRIFLILMLLAGIEIIAIFVLCAGPAGRQQEAAEASPEDRS
jgi:hypothetical protein